MRRLWLVTCLAALGGCGSATFQCENDQDCLRGNRPAGTCEAVGFCSFPDSGCPSGQRYAEASAGFSSKCVPGGPATESTTSEASSSSTGSDESVSDASSPTTTLEPTSGGSSTSGTDTGSGSTTASESTGPMLEEDLALWLDFEPGEADKSPYAHPVSCAATCPSGVGGVFGAGALFDADYLEVAAHPAFDFSASFTLTLWLRADGMNPLGRGTVVSQEYRPGSMTYEMSVQDLDGQPPFDLVVGAGAVGSAVPDAIALGSWQFIVVRVEGGQQQVFVDGEEVSFGALAPPSFELAPVFVGGLPSIGFSFIGAIDDVRLYRRALTDEELGSVGDGEPVY